jgi:hypothetical protein
MGSSGSSSTVKIHCPSGRLQTGSPLMRKGWYRSNVGLDFIGALDAKYARFKPIFQFISSNTIASLVNAHLSPW